MVSLEQVKLLESKVTRTIEYVKKVTEENRKLKEKLDSYQKRTDDLEVLIQRFKEDQSKIEDGILSALDRLNQFEDALENKLSGESKRHGDSKHSGETKHPEIKDSVQNNLVPDIKSDGHSRAAGRGSPPAEHHSRSHDSGKTGPAGPDSEKDSGEDLSGAELDIF
jgi:chromosome segregation ATPase